VTIEKVAHGGHFIARYDGQVLFIRHGIPGEEVTVQVTSRTEKFARADVIEVHVASRRSSHFTLYFCWRGEMRRLRFSTYFSTTSART
jgi:tRNA/tmRNA/rRNA uracil-C5-methylase (TrmA/RlmC/RlmD family)